MEWHPENAGTPYEVLLELLGNWIAADRQEPAFQQLRGPPVAGEQMVWFPETGHTLKSHFQTYWETYGGLAVFGYPISEEFDENGRKAQYFERARFEWWPENQGTVYEVQLGHLGVARATATGAGMMAVSRREGVLDYNATPVTQSFDLSVLMYHHFGDPESRYQIAMWRFEEQLDWLVANGYTTITLAEAYDALLGYGSLPDKPVVLTFDDGYVSHWDAAAALDRRGMRGVFFVTLGHPRMTDWQIKDLSHRGHEIGSHTISHPDLTTLSDEALAYELNASRSQLETITGRPIEFFAYPYGAWNNRVVAAVQAAGYRGAVAALGRRSWTPDLTWVEPRVEIGGHLSLGEFTAFVE
jgi:peptidoglycan/xylan/chitin deacetylase (PgdA/CDA1 family)